MKQYRLAMIPGDGVGPEITKEAERVMDAITKKYSIKFDTTWYDWSCDYYLKNGEMMPENGLEILKPYDSIFLGCIGDANKVADHVSLTMLLAIRKGFDQYVNVRPIKIFPGVYSPVKGVTPETLDMVVIRENTEGEYAGAGGFHKMGWPEGFATQTGYFTQKGTERAVRYAFDVARSRKKLKGGDDGKVGMVTNCTKSNALNYSMVFWDFVYNQVAEDYPDIKTDMALVDAMTMWFVKNPHYFDVIVASNLFGDIITDLGAMIQGGMGFAAGANINPEKDYPSMFEPIHGSAPKYTGRAIVNPVATIESVRMMLEHLDEQEAADDIHNSVATVLGAGEIKTRDMGGDAKTHELGEAIAKQILA
ncbi:MAG: 3-isopropylmalate dehydrogenase [Spirochaeta sp.]|jgi:tartrate dehydrogenase/decarboxylase/D-malate dehydrogenase|nr:3-isopropylmalate dehydrogenase [Spirochaeta sp.]